MNQSQLVLALFDHNLIKFGEVTLKSGEVTYIYADMRAAISYPVLFKDICDKFSDKIKSLKYDFICGVPYSALTFASAIAYAKAKADEEQAAAEKAEAKAAIAERLGLTDAELAVLLG